MKNLFLFTFFLSALLLPFASFSQDYLGFANSAFAGVNGIDVTPASIVNNPRKWDVTIIGINIAGANNYMGLKKSSLDHSGKTFTGNYPAFNDGDNFIKNYMAVRSVKAISVFAGVNVTLPSFMFTRPKQKDAFAFTCKTRVYANIDGIDANLADMIINGKNDSSLFNQDFKAPKVSAQAMIWNEYGITYGRTISQTNNERLNVAGRLKYLQGMYSMYLFVNDVKYNFLKEDSMLIVSSLVHYGHSDNLEFSKDAMKDKFGGKPMFGLDVGATYEFHPLTEVRSKITSQSKTTPLQHEYKYKVGFSIQDLGWIRFMKPANARDFTAQLNTPLGFNSLQGSATSPLAGADDTLSVQYAMVPGDKKYRMNLPTLISVQGDYYAGKNVYVNSTFNYAFQFKNNEDKIHEVTTMSITPRWDWKWLGVYVPLSYNKYSHFRLGLSARIGPLIVGMADLLPLISKRDVYGADFHFLLKVPHIAFKKKNKNPQSTSKFNVNRPKDKKQKRDKPNKTPKPEKKKKKERSTPNSNRDLKPRKHIFPEIKLFKNRKRHTATPEERDKVIYFKL
jgi:hypothetical protein